MTAALSAFVEQFRGARLAAGLSQQQVADRIGLVRSSVANFEVRTEAVPQEIPGQTVLPLATVDGAP